MAFYNIVNTIRLSVTTGIPVIYAGPTGVGKTAGVAAACASPISVNGEEYKYQFKTVNTACMDETDIIGIPKDIEITDDSGKVIDRQTVYSRPSLIIDPNADYKDEPPCVYFVDELSRAPRQVRQALMNVFYPNADGVRRFGDHPLREHDRVVAAYNPAESGYDTDDLDPALLARCSQQTAQGDIAEWETFANKKGYDPLIIQFLKSTGDAPNLKLEDFKPSISKNARTMELAAHLYTTWKKDPSIADRQTVIDFMYGLIGHDAYKLTAFEEENEFRPYAMEELLGMSYDEVKKYFKLLNDNNRVDVQNDVCNGMKAYIKSRENYTDEDHKLIIQILTSVNREVQSTFIDEIINNREGDSHLKDFLKDITRRFKNEFKPVLTLFAAMNKTDKS